MTIKHADVIRAVLDGKTVQLQTDNTKSWLDYTGEAALKAIVHYSGSPWRIKPETLVTWHPVHTYGVVGYGHNTRDSALTMHEISHLLRLERDPETLDPISITKEQP